MRQFQNLDELKQWCQDKDLQSTIVFADLDYSGAVVGISSNDALIYSHAKMVEYLMKNFQFIETDAIEFIDVNTIASLASAKEPRPIIMYDIED